MTNDLKQLFMSDAHFPKQDNRAIELFLKVAKAFKPDALDLCGDLDDAECTGRWVEGQPAEYVSIESGSNLVKQFLVDFNEASQDKHFHGGNHDYYRHQNYMLKHAPNAMSFITPDSLYGIKDAGFEWHDYELPPVKRLGGLYAHHGDSISKHSAESARNDVQNHMVSIVRGHSHRMGSYFRSYPLAGIEVEGHEIGHMTVPNKHTYQNIHDWQLGFAYAHITDGVAHFNLARIKDYTAWIDGVKYQA
jgi:predicted phosphodiesterase